MPRRPSAPAHEAYFVRGTRMFPVARTGPFVALDEAQAHEGPRRLEAGWTCVQVVQSGTAALATLRAPASARASVVQRLFFVHGATAAPVEAPSPEGDAHRPDYALFAELLAQGWTVVQSAPSGTGALVVAQGRARAIERVRELRAKGERLK